MSFDLHILRHDSLLRITLEGRTQEKKCCGRPRTMFLDWLLKTEIDNIGCDWHETDQAGVGEIGNMP